MLKQSLVALLVIASSMLVNPLKAQVSQGGFPLQLEQLKSVATTSVATSLVVRMPSFNIEQARLKSAQQASEKSIKYAHGFQVSLNPKNSGYKETIDGFSVWQLTITSDSALSMGVIFNKFRVPQGARLFVYNQNMETVLGAFTSVNNKPYNKLAIYPVPGHQVTIQYEEPIGAEFEGELEIGKINHDFLGVANLKNRWDRRPSGSCHEDINCGSNQAFEEIKRSVVRILADDELGTGTLLNNTNQDGKPLLISAFHIYDSDSTAQISLYDFNYESPFCTGIDGYDLQTISGSTALASFDSLDFILVELNEVPPPSYRPYYAGWSAVNIPPKNSVTIHHPNGDVKKITKDTGICDSLSYANMFLKFAHWKVLNWETGTTEGGSSGSGLFNSDKRLVGTLSGGLALCGNKEYDAFARFNKMWNSYPDMHKQLKTWLDPMNSGTLLLDGFDPYSNEGDGCSVFSNFLMEDSPVTLPENSNKGFYTGNNSLNIDEIAERFSQLESGYITGVAIGIKSIKLLSSNPQLTLNVYSGNEYPEKLEQQFLFPIKKLTDKAMNYFNFDEPVKIDGHFFIGIELPSGKDSVVFYQSNLRSITNTSTLLVKVNNSWQSLGTFAGKDVAGASLLMQVNVCSSKITEPTDTVTNTDKWPVVYPNPARSIVVVESNKPGKLSAELYDMVGNLKLSFSEANIRFKEIDISTLPFGLYVLKIVAAEKSKVIKLVIR